MHDLFTTALRRLSSHTQLCAMGHTPSSINQAVSTGELTRLRKGIYADTPFLTEAKPWEKPMINAAAYFLAHPHAVFSHSTAAQLWGLPVPVGEPVHIYADGSSRALSHGVKKHFLLSDKTLISTLASGARVTGPLTTVVDSVRWLAPGYDLALADAALGHRLVSSEELRHELVNSTGRNCRRMRRIAGLMSPLAESPGESHTRMLLADMGMEFDEQVWHVIDGERFRVDFQLKDRPLIVEFDGAIKLTDFGASDEVLAAERRREKILQNAGWYIFRADWRRVTFEKDRFMRDLWRLFHFTTGHRYPDTAVKSA